MKIGPKAVLVASVVVLVAVGAWARAAYVQPWMQERSAVRIAGKLERDSLLREGDILFQTSRSRQSRAVQDATRSEWSHCGIVVRRAGKWMVFEAVQPVKATPLAEWIARGKENRFALKRLKPSVRKLSPDDLACMEAVGKGFAGKPYDVLFGWDDNRIYCSELIWKIYHRALGVEVGAVQKLSEFDLEAPSVKALMAKRYGKNVPLEDSVVSPVSIYRSPNLETVVESP